MYINCTYMSSDIYCIQSLIHMYIFKRGVHIVCLTMWSLRLWIMMFELHSLLLFFRPWGRLCNCITYKLLCSVVIGCTCKCTVSEFPKTINFFLAVYNTFLCWPFWWIFKLVISFILLTIYFTLYHNGKQNV